MKTSVVPVALDETVDLGEDQSPDALVREVGKTRSHRDHFDVHLLASANIDNCDGPGARGVLSLEEARDLFERTLRGGEADPLHTMPGESFESLQRER